MREDEDGAEAELKERRQKIAETCADEGGFPPAGEARVVGDERHPRDGESDDEIDSDGAQVMNGLLDQLDLVQDAQTSADFHRVPSRSQLCIN